MEILLTIQNIQKQKKLIKQESQFYNKALQNLILIFKKKNSDKFTIETEIIYPMSDRRKQLLLKIIPQRRKTSKKLKHQLIQDIYYRASSMPQKNQLKPQKLKTQQDKRQDQSIRPTNNRFKTNQNNKKHFEESSQIKIMQRKNKSLPKYIGQIPNNINDDSVQLMNESIKQKSSNWDHAKTKIKKFSHKQQKQLHNSSTQKYKTHNLEQILNKKNSKKLIRQSFLKNNNFTQTSPAQKNKQNNKLNNLKYAFQNRKFTNLTKYKPSFTSKANQSFGFNNESDSFVLTKERSLNMRKIQKKNSNQRIKTLMGENNEKVIFEQAIQQRKYIVDLDLTLYLNPSNDSKVNSSHIQTLQHLYQQAQNTYQKYLALKRQRQRQNNTNFNSQQQKTKNNKNGQNRNNQQKYRNTLLNDCLTLLKRIQSQVGNKSKKTMLFIGRLFYELVKYHDCIFYIENVFKQVNYDISLIQFSSSNSIKSSSYNSSKFLSQKYQLTNIQQLFFILTQSYRKTENYLCSIKIMNQWQKNIVFKAVFKNGNSNNHPHKLSFQQKRKKTISSFQDSHLGRQKNRKNSSNTYYSTQKIQVPSINQYDTQKNAYKSQSKQQKPIKSTLKQNIFSSSNKIFNSVQQDKINQSKQLTYKKSPYFSTNYKVYPSRSRQLSIKTLSNLNEYIEKKSQRQQNMHKMQVEDLTRYSEKQVFVEGYLMKARIQYELKNYYSSVEDYLKVLACQNMKVQAGLQLGTIYYKIGKKDKSISFLQQFLQNFIKNDRNNLQDINQIRYHLGVILYKSAKYFQSFKTLQQIQRQGRKQQFLSQIYFYEAMNLFKTQKFESKDQDQNQKQSLKIKQTQQILMYLQKCIDHRTSEFYLFSAYFMKIYLLIFRLKNYYAAQYQIDRMRNSFNNMKFSKKKEQNILQRKVKNQSKSIQKNTIKQHKFQLKQQMDYKKISVQDISHIICLQDLISLTEAIIYILKLKLNKGLNILSFIQGKIQNVQKSNLFSSIVSIQNPTVHDAIHSKQKDCNSINEALKLIFQFKYYAYYAKRQYKKAMKYLLKISEIAKQNNRISIDQDNQRSSDRSSQKDSKDKIINPYKKVNHNKVVAISFNKKPYPQTQQQNQQTMGFNLNNKQTIQSVNEQELRQFEQQNDRINYLVLKSLTLMERQKFEQALNKLKIVQDILSPSRSSSILPLRNSNSLSHNSNLDSLQTIALTRQYKKQRNYLNTIKSLCYILLYKYLQNANQTSNIESYRDSFSLKKKQRLSNQIKIQQSKVQQSLDIELHQQNKQILLAAEDLLSQCLICDKQNYQILYLISFIHYQLKRYQSSLNYIRQAIQLSDDHMIKHYYLKANVKLLLGKYDESIKDYSNAITVYKQLQKQKQNYANQNNQYVHTSQFEDIQMSQTRLQGHQTINSQTLALNNSGQMSSSNQHTLTHSMHTYQNQYYQEQQEMHFQIYLHRAVAYLKYAYFVQYQSKQNNKIGKYEQVRQNIISLRATAAQDIKQYFIQIIKLIKANNKRKEKMKENQKGNTFEVKLKTSQSKRQTIQGQEENNIIKNGKFLKLLLHTSEVEWFLEINKSFASELDIKLATDQQLIIYFYIAKQLNNCLLMMDKMIKKYYLSNQNLKNNIKKKSTSKSKYQYTPTQSDKFQPYFKSKKQKRQSSMTKKLSSYNSKNSPKQGQKQKINNRYHNQSLNQQSHQNHHGSNHQQQRQRNIQQNDYNIRKLVFDKKILSALKDSSSNSQEDYENALISLLQQHQIVQKQIQIRNEISQSVTSIKYDNFQGKIFKYPDLLFFIGVLYYLLDDYQNSLSYFIKSHEIKVSTNQLYSIQNLVVSTSAQQKEFQMSLSCINKQISLQNLKAFQEIYQNRIYSKQEILYNIGVIYLLNGDYNQAYDYLDNYQPFIQIIEAIISEKVNSSSQIESFRSPPKENKSKYHKLHIQRASFQESQSKIQTKKRQKTEQSMQKDQSTFDITPFPTHNRLCSIYPAKQLNGKQFRISFCLPKIQLPMLKLFQDQQIQIAQVDTKIQKKSLKQTLRNLQNISSIQSPMIQSNQRIRKSHIRSEDKFTQPQRSKKFLIQKQNFNEFINIISLKDIQMKPNAPWIRKDRQKRCIKFTDNFINESFDLRTQCNTQRKVKPTSRKQMFGGQNRKKQFEINFNLLQNQKLHSQTHSRNKLQPRKNQQKFNGKEKLKQKQYNKRYETIDHNQ